MVNDEYRLREAMNLYRTVFFFFSNMKFQCFTDILTVLCDIRILEALEPKVRTDDISAAAEVSSNSTQVRDLGAPLQKDYVI